METPVQLMTFGGLFAAGLVIYTVGHATRLPRITLLVLFGLAAGNAGFDIIPAEIEEWREIISIVALTMIAFLLGGELSLKGLARHGRAILTVSVSVILVSLAVISGGLLILGIPFALAMALAGIGLATDPATTRDVVKELGARGRVTKTLLGVVAIDDAWGVMVFSIILGMVSASGSNGFDGLIHGLSEVGIAILIGVAIGVPAALLSGRLKSGEPLVLEAASIVFVCAGLAIYFNVSFLLAGMVAGVVVVNLAQHHTYSFHEIEHISLPFLILFFVLAGSSLKIESVWEAGVLGAAFVALRMLARVAGGWVGGRLGGLSNRQSVWMGVALMPQAGVALGMAIAAGEAIPEYADRLMTVTIATVVFFELLGPLTTSLSLKVVGEGGGKHKPRDTK